MSDKEGDDEAPGSPPPLTLSPSSTPPSSPEQSNASLSTESPPRSPTQSPPSSTTESPPHSPTQSPPPPPTGYEFLPPGFKVSKFVQKLEAAPPGYFFEPESPPDDIDPFAAPTGPYFFYGTLAAPAMLQNILGLETEPEFRPATITGYEIKRWGPYPALLNAPEKVVHGYVYHVESGEDGERLATYETENYETKPCRIDYVDGNEPANDFGWVFKFAGNVEDLRDGTFDLEGLRRNMERVASVSR
ncbi:hypothetical protein PENSTE_c001G08427 [Penicillium steckii]|uniref:Putative gamma-glutamylcyclotransferase n=1 Tax=Penicillium steckii TaxID=303698 RepID=A0A1V6U0P1_9EURO|nr:hypothetical protein PENSTE_c001G08427 [Penicillium steckii]